MNSRVLQISLVLLSLAFAAPAQTTTGWSLIWSDEFAQPNGSSPDASKWVFDLGGNGWGNNELETYTSRTNNARIENGQLVIEARQENFTGADGIPRNYTSARLKTKTKEWWTYGRLEARLKIPRGQGIWPAFWTLGTNIDAVSWPNCGEIDIMENIGSEPALVHGTAHGPGYSGGSGPSEPFPLLGGGAFADDFHLFAVEWETNRLRWYMDNQLYFTIVPASLPGGTTWVFTKGQFLLLNVAVGGNWPGPPNGSTVFPQRMTVDYVRVYSGTNVPACSGNALPNPGFELGGLGNWVTFGANTYLENISNVPVHSGSNVFKVYGQFSGGANSTGVFRDFPTSPGSTNTAAAWALTQPGDKIAGSNTAWMEVSYRDSFGNVLSLYRSALISSNTTAGAWLNLSVTNQLNPSTGAIIGTVNQLVAPAGTVSARCQLVFRQPALAAGSVLFDDATFMQSGVNEPIVPAALTKSSGNVSISFPTYLGLNYEVRYRDDLDAGLWQSWTNIVGDGTTNTVTEGLTEAHRFYQVVRVCN